MSEANGKALQVSEESKEKDDYKAAIMSREIMIYIPSAALFWLDLTTLVWLHFARLQTKDVGD